MEKTEYLKLALEEAARTLFMQPRVSHLCASVWEAGDGTGAYRNMRWPGLVLCADAFRR